MVKHVPIFGEWDENVSASGGGYSQLFDNLRNEKKGVNSVEPQKDQVVLVPKFGEWDVNVPASGEGYSQVFDYLRNEKKGINSVAPQQTITGNGNYRAVNKFKTYLKYFKNSFNSIKKKWFSCVPNA